MKEKLKIEAMKKLAFMKGDPNLTAGKNQETISSFKDLYGIFNVKNKHKRKRSPNRTIKQRKKEKSPSKEEMNIPKNRNSIT